jgi:archaellum component FlaC
MSTMPDTIEDKFRSLHDDLKSMQSSSRVDQENLRKELRAISDKITVFSENFARLEGLNYGKQIDKLEESESKLLERVSDLESYKSKMSGAVAVLYIIATALAGAVISVFVKSN